MKEGRNRHGKFWWIATLWVGAAAMGLLWFYSLSRNQIVFSSTSKYSLDISKNGYDCDVYSTRYDNSEMILLECSGSFSADFPERGNTVYFQIINFEEVNMITKKMVKNVQQKRAVTLPLEGVIWHEGTLPFDPELKVNPNSLSFLMDRGVEISLSR
ncbi:hypothetical protein C0431_03760 [bacterium]|nr:hypothetical protein [bacterium]